MLHPQWAQSWPQRTAGDRSPSPSARGHGTEPPPPAGATPPPPGFRSGLRAGLTGSPKDSHCASSLSPTDRHTDGLTPASAPSPGTDQHLTSVKMAIFPKTTDDTCWQECGEKGSLNTWQEWELAQSPRRTVRRFSRTKNRTSTGHSSSSVDGIPKERSHAVKDTCTPTFIGLFTTAETRKQRRVHQQMRG